MHRSIYGLRHARELKSRPAGIPIGRPRGAKRMGILFEDQVADRILRSYGRARQGVWFEFIDRNGPGWCQPDIILPFHDRVVVFECKYTWTPVGWSQIDQLYRPVVEAVFGLPVQGIVVSKVLTPYVEGEICSGLREALDSPRGVWHCLDIIPRKVVKQKKRRPMVACAI